MSAIGRSQTLAECRLWVESGSPIYPGSSCASALHFSAHGPAIRVVLAGFSVPTLVHMLDQVRARLSAFLQCGEVADGDEVRLRSLAGIYAAVPLGGRALLSSSDLLCAACHKKQRRTGTADSEEHDGGPPRNGSVDWLCQRHRISAIGRRQKVAKPLKWVESGRWLKACWVEHTVECRFDRRTDRAREIDARVEVKGSVRSATVANGSDPGE